MCFRCIAYSQPHINNIVVLGCITCLGCVFLLGLDGRFVPEDMYAIICQVSLCDVYAPLNTYFITSVVYVIYSRLKGQSSIAILA